MRSSEQPWKSEISMVWNSGISTLPESGKNFSFQLWGHTLPLATCESGPPVLVYSIPWAFEVVPWVMVIPHVLTCRKGFPSARWDQNSTLGGILGAGGGMQKPRENSKAPIPCTYSRLNLKSVFFYAHNWILLELSGNNRGHAKTCDLLFCSPCTSFTSFTSFPGSIFIPSPSRFQLAAISFSPPNYILKSFTVLYLPCFSSLVSV